MKNCTKSTMPLKTVALCAILLGLTINAWAASRELDNVSFSESYADKTACTGSNADGDLSCGTHPTGKFNLTAALSTNSYGDGNTIDGSTLNSNTPVSIRIGNWSLANDFADGGTLGDAAKLTFKTTKNAGANSVTATFYLMDDVAIDANCDTASKKEGVVELTITDTELTLSVSANTGDDNYACEDSLDASPDASNFDGETSGPTNSDVTVSISVGDNFSVSTDVMTDVSVSTTTLKDGSAATVSKISEKGTGSF